MMIMNYVIYNITRWTYFIQLTHTADDAKAKHMSQVQENLWNNITKSCVYLLFQNNWFFLYKPQDFIILVMISFFIRLGTNDMTAINIIIANKVTCFFILICIHNVSLQYCKHPSRFFLHTRCPFITGNWKSKVVLRTGLLLRCKYYKWVWSPIKRSHPEAISSTVQQDPVDFSSSSNLSWTCLKFSFTDDGNMRRKVFKRIK